jgi:bifunctional oligoribonuclease and PAP phosphatase NrnA
MEYYPENSADWIKIGHLLRQAECIFITTHINPDGDAIGSVMALAGFLKKIGKKYRVVIQSSVVEMYKFLDPEGVIESFPDTMPAGDSPGERDLVIFLDLGKFDRTGNVMEYLVHNHAQKIIIDHHPPETVEANHIVVNPRAEATGSLVYDFICQIEPSVIDKKIALAVLTAIVTDTGYFRYGNTTSVTHLVAASLYEHGARVGEIRKALETGQPFSRQKLLGYALANLRLSSCGRIVYSWITLKMFRDSGARREHTDGIIDQLRIIKNIKVAALIVQDGTEQYKVSFRTVDSIPANDIASMLGGGGHPRAAGATRSGNLEKVIDSVLKAATSVLNTERNE